MIEIKFSHFYSKLPRDFQYSKLLQVLPVKLEDLSPDFRQYDTSYLDGGEERQFPIPPEGDGLLILLQAGSGHGHLWTTTRVRCKDEIDRFGYYQAHVGDVVECKVVE